MKSLFFIVSLLSLSYSVYSQSDSLSNWRTRIVSVQDTMQPLDSLTIIPETVKIYRSKTDQTISQLVLSDTFYTIQNNQFFFNTNTPDSLVYIHYRVLPFNLSQHVSHLDTTLAEIDESGRIIGYQYNPYKENPNVLDFKGLDYNGSFSRGISFGNNQNLVLNSSFNLQMAGEIGEGIEILAAITDENIPLQAEGNTQQLREFDKIFIQLKKNNNQLIAGDYELTRPNSYFMNYYKKLQGATFSNKSKLSENSFLNSKASVAISRGKFARNNIVQQEGNQGPYKLQGSNGERFIIALAGTEKVYLDGALLTRGLEEDYIIDYNRAEVEFTNKRLITKDSRIIVEFEYSDQNYVRSMYALNTEYQKDKLKLYLNVFSEQDGKKPTLDRPFTEEEQLAFLNAGDNTDNIFVQPSIDSVDFDEFRILYKLTDTIVEGLLFRDILVRSTAPDSAIYAANFVEVAFGEGNYIQVPASESAANGRVYQWVAPDLVTGQAQGNFISARRLVAPQRQQLYTAGGAYQVGKNTTIKAEIGMSNVDANRFSNLNQSDDLGFSAFSSVFQGFDLGKQKNGWRLETELNYEFKQDRFQALNPYRNAEFIRDWNIDDDTKATEQVGTGGLTLRKKGLGYLKYEFGGFLRDTFYIGNKHFSQLNIKQKGWELDASGSLLEAENVNETSHFFRPKVRLSKTFKKLADLKIGAYGEREKNQRFALLSDSLNANSFYYDLYRFYIESPSAKRLNVGVAYTQRLDYAPVQTDFKNTTIADEFNINGSWNARQKKDSKYKFTGRLNWNLTYRELQILDSTLTNQDAKETYLGRVDYNWSWLKGAIRSNTVYEIGSGQEPKIEYVYLEVPSGEGVYNWIDYNEDGDIQINEFEVAVFQDNANYIRSSIFTDEFVRSNNVSLNQSLRIDPKAIWFQEKKFKKFMTRFSTQSTLRITRKTREIPNVSPWNPFQFEIPDTALVATTSIIRNSLFFNRTDPKYSLELGQSDTRNRVVLTTGYESRATIEQYLKGRWNISKAISWQLELNKGIRENDSEFFNNKDYSIDYIKVAPKITWQPSKTFRTILTYEFSNSENTLIEQGERSLNHDINAEMTYNRTATTSIRSKFSLVKVDFSGEANSPVGFAMLQGLQNGQNFLWNLALDRKIAKNIQLSLSYEGRKTGQARIVHVGRATVRALF